MFVLPVRLFHFLLLLHFPPPPPPQVTWDKKGVGPIAISDAIFIRDNRYSIRRSRVSDWALVIHAVRPEDSGTYRCQINLSKLKEKVFTLKVEGEAKGALQSRSEL